MTQSKIHDWLNIIGLGALADRFTEEDISWDVVPELDEDDLKELGLSLGQRKKVLRAIADLPNAPVSSLPDVHSSPDSPAPEPNNPDAAISEGERRPLTVLFCDLIDSVPLSTEVDAEELRNILQLYRNTCNAIVKSFNGYVAQYRGDGVLVFFGYPRAEEDTVANAIRAGLKIAETIPNMNFSMVGKNLKLSLRMGIHTGVVVTSENSDARPNEDDIVYGEVPNVAARLQQIAKPNTVAITEQTKAIVAPFFELEQLPAVKVKGLDRELIHYAVVGEATDEPTHFETSARRGLTPMVNRLAEIQYLMDRWQTAASGEGQAVLLTGEAGIGKSRLAREIRAEIQKEDHVYVGYQCSSHHSNTALFPIIDQLERAAQIERNDDQETRRAKLKQLLQPAIPNIDSVLPAFEEILSAGPSGELQPPDVDAEKRKHIFLSALLDHMAHLCRTAPLLVFVEDLHWMDPSSLEFLNDVMERAQSLSTLVLMTARPEFVAKWGNHPHLGTLSVNRLNRQHRIDLIDKLTDGIAFPDDLVDHIVTKTDGVPLYLEELTKNVQELGVLKPVISRYDLVSPASWQQIPSTLHDSLMARLDRMGTAKEVAQFASAIGREFSFELLAEAASMPIEKLTNALDQLVDAQIMFRRGSPPDVNYMFKHALVQDIAYQSLLTATKRKIHERIAEAMVELDSDRARLRPELPAHHFTCAERFEDALQYLLKAGQHANESSAPREAIFHADAGLALLERLPDGEKRTRHRLELLLVRGPGLMHVHGMTAPIVEENYADARQCCDALGDASHMFTVTFGLWLNNEQRGNLTTAKQLVDDLFNHADDKGLVLQAHHAAWPTLFSMGEMEDALKHAKQGIDLYVAEQHKAHASRYGGHDPGVCARVHASMALWFLGYPEQSRENAYDGLELAKTLDHSFSLVHAHYFISRCHQFRNEPDECAHHAQQVVSICKKFGFSAHEVTCRFMLGWAHAAGGDLESGIADMEDARSSWNQTGAELRRAYYLILLADAYRQAARDAEGLAAIEKSLVSIEKIGERRWEAEAYRLNAELLLMSGRDDRQAEKLFQRSIKTAKQQSTRSIELRAATGYARHLHRTGRSDKARESLTPIYNWFTEGHHLSDLKAASAMLQKIETAAV